MEMLLAPTRRQETISVAKKEPESHKLPKSPTVKLEKEFFAALWWVGRVEGRPLADILKDLASLSVSTRRKRYEADVEKLRRIDAAELEAVTQAQGRIAE
jgi:hypothetical protein